MENIISKTSDYVKKYFSENLPDWAKYHDLEHTLETVEGCLEIGHALCLNNNEFEILLVAAWFHDIGYTSQAEGHEERSAELATAFLRKNSYPEDKIIAVNNCIMSTKISSQPRSSLGNIIRDADLVTLGKKNYLERNNLLREEMELRTGIFMTELEWLKRSIDFLKSHSYLTDYAKLTYNEQLQRNIEDLDYQLRSIASP